MFTLRHIIETLIGAHAFFYPDDSWRPLTRSILYARVKADPKTLTTGDYFDLVDIATDVERQLKKMDPLWHKPHGSLLLARDFFGYIKELSPPGFLAKGITLARRDMGLLLKDFQREYSEKKDFNEIAADHELLYALALLGCHPKVAQLYKKAFSPLQRMVAITRLLQQSQTYKVSTPSHLKKHIDCLILLFDALIHSSPKLIKIFLDPDNPDYISPALAGTINGLDPQNFPFEDLVKVLIAIKHQDDKALIDFLISKKVDDNIIEHVMGCVRTWRQDPAFKDKKINTEQLQINLIYITMNLVMCACLPETDLSQYSKYINHPFIIQATEQTFSYSNYLKRCNEQEYELLKSINTTPLEYLITHYNKFFLQVMSPEEWADIYITRTINLREWFDWFTPEAEQKMALLDVVTLAEFKLNDDFTLVFKTGHAETGYGLAFELCYPYKNELYRLAYLGFQLRSNGEIRIVCLQGANPQHNSDELPRVQSEFLAFSGGLTPHQWISLTMGKILLQLSAGMTVVNDAFKWIRGEYLAMAYPHKGHGFPEVKTAAEGLAFWEAPHPELEKTNNRYIKLKIQHDILSKKLDELKETQPESDHITLNQRREASREALKEKLAERIEILKKELMLYETYQKGRSTIQLYRIMAKKLGFKEDKTTQSPWLTYSGAVEDFGAKIKKDITDSNKFQESEKVLQRALNNGVTFDLLHPNKAPIKWEVSRNIFASDPEDNERVAGDEINYLGMDTLNYGAIASIATMPQLPVPFVR